MLSNPDVFESMEPTDAKVLLADGKILYAEGSGSAIVKCHFNRTVTTIRLLDTLYIPSLARNLISVSKVAQAKRLVVLPKHYGEIRTMTPTEKVIARFKATKSVYTLLHESHAAYTTESDLTLWHDRYGHVAPNTIVKVAKSETVTGIPENVTESKETPQVMDCASCVLGKMKKLPYQSSYHTCENPMDRWHMDITVPKQVASLSGNRSAIVVVDDFTGMIFTTFVEKRCQFKNWFCRILFESETLHNQKLKNLRSDNAGEFISKKFKEFLASRGIHFGEIPPYTPQLNRTSERSIQTLSDLARTMLIDSKLPRELWCEAFAYAAYIRNRTMTRKTGKNPYELWYGEKPDVSHLRVFGSTAWLHVPPEKRKKLDKKTQECVLVGYASSGKCYRLLDKRELYESYKENRLSGCKQKVILGRDVFWEIKEV